MSTSHITLPICLDKEELNRLLAKRVPQIELRDNLKITNITLDGQDSQFILYLEVTGLYNGMVTMFFTPRFVKDNHSLILDDLRLEMEQKGLLSKGINWMINGVMKQKIEDAIQSQLDKKLKEIVSNYLKQEQKIDLPDGIKGHITVDNFDIVELLFTGSNLKILADIWGDIAINLDTQKMA